MSKYLTLSLGILVPDLLVVNIGIAHNLSDELKLSLSKNGLDFSKAIAFMSDTINVMKGARSGAQNLIKK